MEYHLCNTPFPTLNPKPFDRLQGMFSEVIGSSDVDADIDFLIKSWDSQFGVTPKPKEWRNIVESDEVRRGSGVTN